ncbi:MAG: phosphate ABC transporter substrate-binding protein [Anaerovoracaceae bacterium]|jgi:phosphate transport system substrate-binding protein
MLKGKKKFLCIGLTVAMCAAAFTACGSSSTSSSSSSSADSSSSGTVSGTVTASGSSALQPLAQQAADDFMAENPDCTVTINGGGSGEGLKQVADGAVDIGNSDVFAEEKLDASAASELVDHEVALITVAPVVNKDLGVDNLSTEDLKGIFTGQITNWSEVGGPDLDIMLVTRPSSSGTRALFKEYALEGEEESSSSALETDDSGTLMETISQNKGAIGYVALSYLVNNDSAVAVSIDNVEPTLENTYSGKYNVWGYEHMYTKGEGSEAAQAFIEYLSGDKYANSVEDLGYGAISKLSDEAAKAHESSSSSSSSSSTDSSSSSSSSSTDSSSSTSSSSSAQ